MTKSNIVLVIAGLICLNFIAWFAVFEICSSPDLKVSFLNVGQGDAIFIEIAPYYQILIDGGPGKKVLSELSERIPEYDKTIDLILLTHPDKDHLEGLIAVLEQYDVENIIWTGIVKDTTLYQEWLYSLEKENTNIIIGEAGQKIYFSNAVLNILHPFESIQGSEPKDANQTSLVSQLCLEEVCFLFTGDIYSKQEKELISLMDLESEVLKLGHHGSKTSTSEEFILAVDPIMAVAQVGENNSYGHPNEQVVQRLEDNGIQFLTTMFNDIEVVVDNNQITINYE